MAITITPYKAAGEVEFCFQTFADLFKFWEANSTKSYVVCRFLTQHSTETKNKKRKTNTLRIYSLVFCVLNKKERCANLKKIY